MKVYMYSLGIFIMLLVVFQYSNPLNPYSYVLPSMFVLFFLSIISKRAFGIMIFIGLIAVVLHAGAGRIIKEGLDLINLW